MTKEFQTVDQSDIVESPTAWIIPGSGRARCRICREKITKGVPAIAFYASFYDAGYHSWTSIECKVHESCAPDIRIRPLVNDAVFRH